MWSHYPSPQSSSSVASPLLTSAEGTVQHPLRGFSFGLRLRPSFLPLLLYTVVTGRRLCEHFELIFIFHKSLKSEKFLRATVTFQTFRVSHCNSVHRLILSPPPPPQFPSFPRSPLLEVLLTKGTSPQISEQYPQIAPKIVYGGETKGTFLPRNFQTHGPHICYSRCSWDMGTV